MTSFSSLVPINRTKMTCSKDRIIGSIALRYLLVIGWHFLPLSNARFVATEHFSLGGGCKYVIFAWASDVPHCYASNVPPIIASINGSWEHLSSTVYSIHVSIASINLLKSAIDALPPTAAWLFAFEYFVSTVHSPYIAISTCRHVLQAARDSDPFATSIHWSFEDLVRFVHSPDFMITGINLLQRSGNLYPASLTRSCTHVDLMGTVDTPEVVWRRCYMRVAITNSVDYLPISVNTIECHSVQQQNENGSFRHHTYNMQRVLKSRSM